MNGPPPRWLAALPALFGIGAKMGGSTPVGTGALVGAEHANQQARVDMDRQAILGQRQQDLDIRAQQIAAQEVVRAQHVAQQREGAIKAAVDDLRVQKFPTKSEYDQAVAFRENLIGQTFGPVRPNILRTLAPYNGPNVESRAREAVEALVKAHGPEIFAKPAMVQIDRDEDGVPENVPILEAASLGKFPIARDEKGQPMLPPKEVKADNVQPFDEAYKNTLAQWQAEGKDINSPRVKLAAQKAAAEFVAQSQKSPADPTLDAIRQLTLAQARQNATTKMYSPGQERAVNMLADDYARDSKDFSVRAQSYDTVRGAAKEPTAAGDLSLIFAYMKMLDPGSVVREGEFATAQNATGVPDRVRNLYNQVTKGVRLNPAQRADFVKQAGNIYHVAKERQDRITGAYTQRAKRRGLDPNDVIVDYGATDGPKPAAEAPPAAGKGAAITVVAPNGKTYTFATQEQADRFKAASGAK